MGGLRLQVSCRSCAGVGGGDQEGDRNVKKQTTTKKPCLAGPHQPGLLAHGRRVAVRLWKCLSRGKASAQASGSCRPWADTGLRQREVNYRVEFKVRKPEQGPDQIWAGDFLLDCTYFA